MNFKCSGCGEVDSSKFYGHKKTCCKSCHNKYTKELARKKKLLGIDYLGGKCSSCGFIGHPSVFDFHHTNPKEKDKNFTSMKNWSFDKIKKELDKCILLCANCHRLEHSDY